MEPRLLKGQEVAEILQVSKAYAYVLMNRGEIPLVRIGKIVRVRLEDLERYIKEKTAQNETPIGPMSELNAIMTMAIRFLRVFSRSEP